MTFPRNAVTVKEWDAYSSDTGGYSPEKGGHGIGDDRAVVNVTWCDVQAYIKWINAKTNATYRLPTEAEWEYSHIASEVTRRKVRSKYEPGHSGSISPLKMGTTKENDNQVTNKWGIFGMQGLVWEWVHDWHGEYDSGLQIDPKGPSSGVWRVLRGGGFLDNTTNPRSTGRFFGPPDDRNCSGISLFGFRLLREL